MIIVYVIIVGIATHGLLQGRRIHQNGMISDERRGFLYVTGLHAEFIEENTTQFIEKKRGDDEAMVPNDVFQQFVAHASRDERCNQHIRIQRDPHETCSNTSSSVNTPRA